MGPNNPRKRSRIKGIYRLKRATPIKVLVPGRRKPRTELWSISDSIESDQTTDILGSDSVSSNLTIQFPASASISWDASDSHPSQTTGTSEKKESDYMKNKRKRAERWTELRPLMARALVEEQAPGNFECNFCQDAIFEDFVRCPDCGPLAFFCPDCCVHHHRNLVLHMPEQWRDGQYLPFVLPHNTLKRLGHDCSQYYTKPMLLLDYKGCPHLKFFQFCHCEDEPLTLVRLGFWPATPLNPAIAISIQLLVTLRSLVFAGQISLTAFTASLKSRFETQYSQHPDVCKVFTWDMVLNFNLVHHEVTSLEIMCPELMSSQTCPACPENNKIIAMDGNFSLVRRRRNTTQLYPVERHPERFFLPQKEVDDFVEKYNESSVKTKECSNFQAGSVLRSKNKSDKLDVKGIFGSVCRHDRPYKFFDLRHGERMGYPVYLFNQIKDTTKLLLYDIACQFESHLKRRVETPQSLVFAVPIFHVYGHQMDCQVNYNPRRIKGFGLCDGEGTERLWSYLGEFSNITKEMTVENRRDLITELLLHYSSKLTNQLVKTLCLKMMKASLTLSSTDTELVTMMASFPGEIREESIQRWSQAESDRKKETRAAVSAQHTWRGPYVLLLHDFYEQGQTIIVEGAAEEDLEEEAMKLARLEIQLRRIERKEKIRRWAQDSQQYTSELSEACETTRKCRLIEVRDKVIQYTFLCYQRKKRSDGQSIAKRITQQILTCSKNLETAIKNYNEVPSIGEGVGTITRQESLNLESNIYFQILDDNDNTLDPQIPSSNKRKAIDVLNLNYRAREEIQLVLQDIRLFKDSVAKRIEVLQTKIDELESEEFLERYEVGCVCLMKKALTDVKRLEAELEKSLSPFLSQSQLDVNSFIDHIESLESSTLEDMNKTELHAILHEVAMFEKEADELELQQDDE